MTATYIYPWRNNEKRRTLYGRPFRILARGRANSALVEFDAGQREVISRNAIRKPVSTIGEVMKDEAIRPRQQNLEG